MQTLSILFVPFLTQGLFIAVDEFYFHYKRGLKTWERVSHPVDTFTTLVCSLFLLVAHVNSQNILIYLGLALFSCLLVTKDEWVHIDQCDAKEQWLHSVLFMLHPLVLTAGFYLWWSGASLAFIKFQSGTVFLFLTYQVTFWVLRRKE